MTKRKKVYFPGWTRKAITFTNDDGNLRLDEKFINIVKPHGILGTFNLTAKNLRGRSDAECRELYRGYEVANHTMTHPFLLPEEQMSNIADEPFDKESADPTKTYRVPGEEGRYYISTRAGFRVAVDLDTYKRDVDEGQAEIERVFGEGSSKIFIWPYCEQKNEELFEYIKSRGYYGIRTVGALRDKTGFNLPADRNRWSYNATHVDLMEVAELFEAYPDDGELKMFCFGLHSHDYENQNKWGLLEEFSKRYGGRTSEFWYASVGDIFAYEDAVNMLEELDGKIINNSDLPLYLIIDGAKIVLNPGEACLEK